MINYSQIKEEKGQEKKRSYSFSGGQNPVEYELAALTGCFNVVAHLVAQEMDIELHSLELEANGELNPSKFQGEETEERAGFQQVSIDVEVESDADEEEIKKLFEQVEERCPVRDNISHKTPVAIEINS